MRQVYDGSFIGFYFNLLNEQNRKDNHTMNQSFEILGVYQVLKQLKEYANTIQAKEMIANLEPHLSEAVLTKSLKDTTQAKLLLETVGTPPLPLMENIEAYIDSVARSELLLPEQIEQIGSFFTAVRRLESYLEKGKEKQIGLAFYSDNLVSQPLLCKEIERTIRHGKIDDYATRTLKNIRRQLKELDEKIRQKAESIIRANKSFVADAFVVNRNGKVCIPVKKQYRAKIEGLEVDKSATGSTVFVEPQAIAKMRSEYELLEFEEEAEERQIIYTLMNMIADKEAEIRENIRIIVMLDFVFSKGKMSVDMGGAAPVINLNRYICIKGARHPLLEKEVCVPLDFEIGNGTRGVIITGPNTGGKTVAIKTVALLSVMACMGLHIPANKAEIAMNSQVLCDIGDGQNLSDNLSTFSAHIKNIMNILKRVNEESLVVLDELGSGTDPTEGRGIAISVLEQLRQSQALFLVTTHYPEVKEYADRYEEIANARMAFDRESLRPLYRLEMGKAGESCALYIAKHLGLPNEMLKLAALEAYGDKAEGLVDELELNSRDHGFEKEAAPKIKRNLSSRKKSKHGEAFSRGDSVIILPEEKIGIVVMPADQQGNVLVQYQKEKMMINHKRLKLKVAASQLYPDDYDFSIIFDTVKNRKARHKMSKGHQEDLTIYIE